MATQFVGRFVEADVTVGADAENLQVDAAGSGDRRFVSTAFGRSVGGQAVEEVDASGLQVHAARRSAPP